MVAAMRAQTSPGKGFRGWKKVLATAGFLDIMIDCSALEYIAMIVIVMFTIPTFSLVCTS